jgi:hypothetical protein
MQYSKARLFSQGKSAEDLSDEELDELFGQLEQFEPPAFLVENIMATVAQLPPYFQQNAKFTNNAAIAQELDKQEY